MKTFEQKADDLINEIADSIHGIDLSMYGHLFRDDIIIALKKQDRDTRHACAEAVITSESSSHLDYRDQVHAACMNAKGG